MSVVVSVYNVEKYLVECIESILIQSLNDIEIIIIDDCSIDNTYKICLNYANMYKNIKIYRKSENSGQSESKNIGIEMATGEYIAFIDGDDYISKDMLANLYYGNNNLDVIGCNIINQFGKIEYDFCYQNNYIYNKETISNEIIPKLILGSLEGFVTAKIFKTTFLKENNIKFVDPPMYEDKIFMMGTFYHAETFKYINFDGYIYRQHYKNTIKQYNRNMLVGLFNIYKNRLKYIELFELDNLENINKCKSRFATDMEFLIKRISLYKGNLAEKHIFLSEIKSLLNSEGIKISSNLFKQFLYRHNNCLILYSLVSVKIKEIIKNRIKKLSNYYKL